MGILGVCGPLHNLRMSGTSSLDLLTSPFESGMLRLVLKLTGLYRRDILVLKMHGAPLILSIGGT